MQTYLFIGGIQDGLNIPLARHQGVFFLSNRSL
jgi:hypothetical protein